MKKISFVLALGIIVISFSPAFAQTDDPGLSSTERIATVETVKTGPQTATITLTIDVPNDYLESKNILEAATIYGVDSKILTQKISQLYGNKFQVEELDTISDLQETQGVKIDDIKQVALSLQNIYPAPAEQKEVLKQVIQEDKIFNQREYVFWTVVIILCLYFISYFLTYREVLHHHIHRRTWNTLLTIAVIGYGLIILSFVVPSIYSINFQIGLGVLYYNLRIGFIIIFLGFSHALRYIFHYRPIKKRLQHNIKHHTASHHSINHKKAHKAEHKSSHPKHTTTKLKKTK